MSFKDKLLEFIRNKKPNSIAYGVANALKSIPVPKQIPEQLVPLQTQALIKTLPIQENVAVGMQRGALGAVSDRLNQFAKLGDMIPDPSGRKLRSSVDLTSLTGTPVTGENKTAQTIGDTLARMGISMAEIVAGGKVLSKVPRIQSMQQLLGSQAGKVIAGNTFKSNPLRFLAGKGLANASQGLPYTLAWQGLNKPSLKEGATDIGTDVALGAIPFVGAGVNVARKAGAKELVRVAELDKLIKSTKDFVEKANLMKERDAILKSVNPEMARESAKELESMDIMKKANDARAEIQKQITPLQNTIKEMKQKVSAVFSRTDIPDNEKRKLASQLYQDYEKTDVEKNLKKLIDERNRVSSQSFISPEPIKPVEAPKPSVKETISQSNGFRVEADNFAKTLGMDEGTFIRDYQLGKLTGTDVAARWKSFTTRLRNWAMKKAGKDMGEVTDYFPKVYADSDKMVTKTIGDNYIDNIGKNTFNPYKSRVKPTTDVEGDYIKDIRKAVDEYVDGVEYEANKALRDAAAKGTSKEAEDILQKSAKKVAEEVQKTGKTTEDVINVFKEAHKANLEAGLAKAKEPIVITQSVGSLLNRLVKDKIQILQKLGLYDHIRDFVNWQQNANVAFYELKQAGLLDGRHINEVASILAKKTGAVKEAIAEVLAKSARFGGNPEKVVETLVEKLYKNKGLEILQDVIGRTEIKDLRTKLWLNENISDVLTKDAKVDNTYVKILRGLRKTATLGHIGANPRSALLNLFEIRRVFATADIRDAGRAFVDAIQSALKRETPYYKKYGFEQIMYVEMPKKYKSKIQKSVKSLENTYDNVGQTLMTMFSRSESFKNSIFTRAYELEGVRKGLSGDALRDYVVDKVRKYAIYGDEWGKPGLFNSELASTIFQFSQYPIREMVIGWEKLGGLKNVPKGDLSSLQYLGTWVATSAVLWKIYEQIGMQREDAVVSTPGVVTALIEGIRGDKPVPGVIESVSPNTRLAMDIYEFAESLANKFIKDAEFDKKTGTDLLKDLVRRIPGGSQFVRTSDYVADVARGYNQTPSGNVRYPVAPKSVVGGVKDAMFGSYTSEYGRQFSKAYDQLGRSPYLGENESDIFRSQFAEDKDRAIKTWQDMVQNKLDKKNEVTIEDIINGKSATKMKEVLASKGDMQGAANVNEILMKDALEETIMSDARAAEKKLLELVNKGQKTTDEMYSDLDTFLQSKGKSLDWYKTKLYSSSDITAKDKAIIIKDMLSRGEMNLADWYKNKLLTEEVAKELFRIGVFNSAEQADDFYKKAKLTDVYYQDEELQKLRKKTAEIWSKAAVDIMKVNEKARSDNVKSVIANLKRSRPKLTMKTKKLKPKVFRLGSKTRKSYGLATGSMRANLAKIRAIGNSKPRV